LIIHLEEPEFITKTSDRQWTSLPKSLADSPESAG
jgi:hypothetical protein